MKKILVALAVVSSLGFCEEQKLLNSHIELGYVQTKGNTDTTTFDLDGKLDKTVDLHSFEFKFDAIYGENGGVQNKNRYTLIANYGYKFSSRVGFTYNISYIDDKFSGYDYQFATGPGLTFDAYSSDIQHLKFKAGVLYAKDRFDNGGIKEYGSYAAVMNYDIQLLEDLKFLQDLTFKGDMKTSQNYFVYSKSSLTTKISNYFSAGLSYKVNYMNLPPQGKKNTDTTLMASLIFDY